MRRSIVRRKQRGRIRVVLAAVLALATLVIGIAAALPPRA